MPCFITHVRVLALRMSCASAALQQLPFIMVPVPFRLPCFLCALLVVLISPSRCLVCVVFAAVCPRLTSPFAARTGSRTASSTGLSRTGWSMRGGAHASSVFAPGAQCMRHVVHVFSFSQHRHSCVRSKRRHIRYEMMHAEVHKALGGPYAIFLEIAGWLEQFKYSLGTHTAPKSLLSSFLAVFLPRSYRGVFLSCVSLVWFYARLFRTSSDGSGHV